MSVIGTEDCLNLAVFTPANKHRKLLPVIVFIHGGGFTRGSYTALGPNYLLDQEVVLVQIHYRLSSLGFLCLTTSHSLPNVGLLDQVLALQWVQTYIKHFGGDPGQVTLIGESAGAAAVSYLMSSPVGRGLFSKAVVMSGANTAQWAVNTRPSHYASGLARALGCSHRVEEDMVRCIKYGRTLDQIIFAGEKYRKELQARGLILGTEIFAPCHDSTFSPLTADSQISNPVPTLVSAVRNEGTLFAALAVAGFYNKARLPPDYFHHQFLVDILRLLKVPNTEVERIKREYFREGELGSLSGVLPGVATVLGTFMIKLPVYNFARLYSEKAPTYLMSFQYQGGNSYFDLIAPEGSRELLDPGVSHGDDLLYLFYTGVLEFGTYFEDRIHVEINRVALQMRGIGVLQENSQNYW